MGNRKPLMTDEEYLAYTGETIEEAWAKVRASKKWRDEAEYQRKLIADGIADDEGMTPEEYADWVCDPVGQLPATELTLGGGLL